MIFEGKPFHLGHHRSLDGIRGVAILLVLLVHGEVIPERSYAFIGVNSFFVLSGFLITCLLVQEYDKSNDISLRHFYLRRALRLLPALMTMLLAFVVFVLLTDHGEGAFQKIHQALFALFYSTNLAKILRVYPAVGTSYLDHTWSLSIEEQFYFVWPAILLFLLRKNSRDSLLCWILLGVFLSVCTRVILFSGIVVSRDVNRLGLGPDTRADSLLLGCFVGVLIASNLLPRSDWFTKVLKKVAIISGIGLFIIGIFSPCTPVMIRVGWLLASVFVAILIAHLMSTSHGLMHRIFENPFLVYTGQISYGLYIWHFPILFAMQQYHLPWQHLMYLLPVLIVVLTSYYLIEKPFLRLKERFARVH